MLRRSNSTRVMATERSRNKQSRDHGLLSVAEVWLQSVAEERLLSVVEERLLSVVEERLLSVVEVKSLMIK